MTWLYPNPYYQYKSLHTSSHSINIISDVTRSFVPIKEGIHSITHIAIPKYREHSISQLPIPCSPAITQKQWRYKSYRGTEIILWITYTTLCHVTPQSCIPKLSWVEGLLLYSCLVCIVSVKGTKWRAKTGS